MITLARKVKAGDVNPDEIAVLVEFAKQQGGIEYAEMRMWEFHAEAAEFIEKRVGDPDIRAALSAYLDYVIKRTK